MDYVITQDNNVIILGQTYNSVATDLVIPETIEGLPVNIIQGYAFYNNEQLTSIYIPFSIETMGSYALKGTANVIINAQVSTKPEGWDTNWNPDGQTVNWGYIN